MNTYYKQSTTILSVSISPRILLQLEALRKQLHSEAELSGKEKNTAEIVTETLKKYKPDELHTQLGGYGILAAYNGKRDGKHILLRCELDALPIKEQNTFAHASKHEGVSHKCGHDGHMAIILGVAHWLHKHPIEKGRVSLLFQPAEENGTGAKAVLDDEKFQQLPQPDLVFALHNVPGMKKGEIGSRTGSFTPSVISLKMKFTGSTSHAGEPEKGKNPAFAIAEIIQQTKQMQHADRNSDSFSVISIAEIQVGNHNYGSSAGQGFIGFTMRAMNNEQLDRLKTTFIQLGEKKASEFDLELDMEWFEAFRSNNNDAECHNTIMQVAKESGLEAMELETPFPWGEDFGLFTEKYTGAMFALGAGKDTPPLHHPGYDFPNALIEPGIKMFAGIIEKTLK